MEELKKQIEKEIENITKAEALNQNIDKVYKLVDMHKDISMEGKGDGENEIQNIRR